MKNHLTDVFLMNLNEFEKKYLMKPFRFKKNWIKRYFFIQLEILKSKNHIQNYKNFCSICTTAIGERKLHSIRQMKL